MCWSLGGCLVSYSYIVMSCKGEPNWTFMETTNKARGLSGVKCRTNKKLNSFYNNHVQQKRWADSII